MCRSLVALMSQNSPGPYPWPRFAKGTVDTSTAAPFQTWWNITPTLRHAKRDWNTLTVGNRRWIVFVMHWIIKNTTAFNTSKALYMFSQNILVDNIWSSCSFLWRRLLITNTNINIIRCSYILQDDSSMNERLLDMGWKNISATFSFLCVAHSLNMWCFYTYIVKVSGTIRQQMMLYSNIIILHVFCFALRERAIKTCWNTSISNVWNTRTSMKILGLAHVLLTSCYCILHQ